VALLLLAAGSAACGTPESAVTTSGTHLRPALPPDDYAAPVPAQRDVAAGSFTLPGNDAAEHSHTAFRNNESHTMWLPALGAGGGWALYSFAGLADGDQPSSVGITLTGDPPAQYWVGISDYAQSAWHWQTVRPEGTDYLDLRSLSQPVSASGACHVVVLAYADIPTEIAQLDLYINLPPLAPTHVVAEPGPQPGEYILSWAKADTATGYEIFRDSQEDKVATVGDVNTWTDTAAGEQDRTYWLKALNDNGASYVSWPAYGRPGPWQLQLLSRRARPHTSLAVVDGKPVIAYVAFDEVDAEEYPYPSFARATTPIPRSASDWLFTTWDEWEDVVNRPTWAAQLNGRPAFTIFRRFYRALTPTPADRDDWQMHLFNAEADISGPVPLLEYDGIPYMVYMDMERNALRFARGRSAAPASGGNWDISTIDEFEIVDSDEYALAFINGHPVVCYLRRDGIADRGELCFARADSLTPAEPADWQVHNVKHTPDYPPGATDIAFILLQDGIPAISYVGDYQDYYSLMFARSLVESPGGPEDWVIHMVRGGFEHAGLGTSMWLVDAKPAICYDDGNGIEYAAANTTAPSSIREWKIETIYEGQSISAKCLRAVNGQPLISFCAKDELFLLTRWD
jgi:hypothetical protein